jgi:hypothetical protein
MHKFQYIHTILNFLTCANLHVIESYCGKVYVSRDFYYFLFPFFFGSQSIWIVYNVQNTYFISLRGFYIRDFLIRTLVT